MLLRHLTPLLAATALALPSAAPARTWQGITPGTSKEADVVARFGEPSTRGRLEGRSALVYKAEQAISGTRQAQFIVGDGGVVTEINVFPANPLERDAVLGTFGKEPEKTFTDDFRPVWRYRAIGVVVFFAKDGSVDAIRYTAAERAPGSPPPPRSAPPAPRPPDQGAARPSEQGAPPAQDAR